MMENRARQVGVYLGILYRLLGIPVVFPSIGQGGEYTFRNEAALTAPLGVRWSLKLANIIDYNSNPQPGFDRADVQYLLTLGFNF